MASAYHHVGIRVGDIDAAARFYTAVLGARVLVKPYTITGQIADQITGCREATMHMCQLGLDEGFIELFQFETSEPPPERPVPYVHQNVLHFGIRVDDVVGALDRVEAQGGARVFSPRRLGNMTYCYCRDPDGNVIELADASMDRVVAIVGAREDGLIERNQTRGLDNELE
jgi:catechol 2,3-dioxygenase-like lactoylglutathione lyase family enzyme